MLSDRVRPNSEAPRWVHEEILKLEAEIERLRRIIWNLLDDGDETDRAEALAALQQKDAE